MEQPMLVHQRIVDTREPWEIRRRLLETGWEQKALQSGDFMFLGHDYRKVGVTRKQVGDLLASIGERFAKQLEEMLDYYNDNVMILEGSWRRINPTSQISSVVHQSYIDWDTAWKWVFRWQQRGFWLLLSTNEECTVHTLNWLYALYQKPSSTSARSRLFTDDRVLALPSGTRGATGLKVLEQLGSLRAVANASVEQLRAVDGIGEKKANLIWQHFNRETDNAGHDI